MPSNGKDAYCATGIYDSAGSTRYEAVLDITSTRRRLHYYCTIAASYCGQGTKYSEHVLAGPLLIIGFTFGATATVWLNDVSYGKNNHYMIRRLWYPCVTTIACLESAGSYSDTGLHTSSCAEQICLQSSHLRPCPVSCIVPSCKYRAAPSERKRVRLTVVM